jgi:hypothetical protein
MAKNKVISITLMVLGAGLVIWGFNLSGGFGSQVTQVFTGSPTDKVMMFYIGGAASFAVGFFLSTKK